MHLCSRKAVRKLCPNSNKNAVSPQKLVFGKKENSLVRLSFFNTVFQAELLGIHEACFWASKINQQIKVWSDRESSLHSIASIDTKSPIAQQTQEIILISTNIKLGWIRAHVGYSGNEAADILAKKATQEEIPTYIPAP
ncbi:hypothetical protein AVEN_147924-1 [Araneus ventricosus]|uniref:RNase H type-1 domain-containing protein n=1 Tax=Araneus ventricosus TaxID=182803 RepID=A0A4Y2UYP8_ARAVE|nr:hypothetical protein AVEN_147924-1 [Araneus ventricosus]